MDSYLEIKKIFEGEADKGNAEAMSKYMRNKFKFYGLPTPKRKELSKDFLKREKKPTPWLFLSLSIKEI